MAKGQKRSSREAGKSKTVANSPSLLKSEAGRRLASEEVMASIASWDEANLIN